VLLAAAVAGEDARLAMLVVPARLLARAGLAGGNARFCPQLPPARLGRLGEQRLTTPEGQQGTEGRAYPAAA